MEFFNNIEETIDTLNLDVSIQDFRASLKELDSLLDKAYKVNEVEKFTVFLTTIIKDDIEIKENKYLNMWISSRKVSALKPKEKGKYLKKFRIKTVNKYSPFLLKSQLFKYDLDEVLFLNNSFDEVVYCIDNLNTHYNEKDILEQLANFKSNVKKIKHVKNIDLTNTTIKLYSQSLTKIECLKRNIVFYETQQESIFLEKQTIEQQFIKDLDEKLSNLENSIINANIQNNLYNLLIKSLKKLNPYLIHQYDRRYLVDAINEDFKIEFENLNPIKNSVVFKDFTDFTKDYRFTMSQHKYLSEIEVNLHKRGFLEIFENKIIWRNSKAELNRICNYLSINVEEFKGKEYNYIIRSIYKRYNLGEPNKNDLRKNKNDSKGYIEDIKAILD